MISSIGCESFTVDPVYSELSYSEHPFIVNGFLHTDR